MTGVQIIFSVKFIQNNEQPINFSPIFYGWSPSKHQALVLKIPEESATLKIWFDRALSYERFARGTTVVRRLSGLLEVENLDKGVERTFQQNKTNYIPYEDFGKRVIKKIIGPTLSKLFDILRINFGQYWVPDFSEWDSRNMFLGQYCQSLDMKWSLDGKSWLDFYPASGVMAAKKFRVVGDSFFQQFISKEDWKAVKGLIGNNYEPSLAAGLLRRAHVYFESGDLRMSFIEGISSLEISIKEFLSARIGRAEILSKTIDEFLQIGLRGRLVAIGISHGSIPPTDIEDALKAIDIRNKIVHHGIDPSLESKTILRGLFRTVSFLLGDASLKFPEIAL